jgi:hypothetical protein
VNVSLQARPHVHRPCRKPPKQVLTLSFEHRLSACERPRSLFEDDGTTGCNTTTSSHAYLCHRIESLAQTNVVSIPKFRRSRLFCRRIYLHWSGPSPTHRPHGASRPTRKGRWVALLAMPRTIRTTLPAPNTRMPVARILARGSSRIVFSAKGWTNRCQASWRRHRLHST